ncbi:MAG: hypothetical protein J3K34DRAFT_411324, partial [Monoraphidium minutum]
KAAAGRRLPRAPGLLSTAAARAPGAALAGGGSLCKGGGALEYGSSRQDQILSSRLRGRGRRAGRGGMRCTGPHVTRAARRGRPVAGAAAPWRRAASLVSEMREDAAAQGIGGGALAPLRGCTGCVGGAGGEMPRPPINKSAGAGAGRLWPSGPRP